MDAICKELWIKCVLATKFLVFYEKRKGLSEKKLIPHENNTPGFH